MNNFKDIDISVVILTKNPGVNFHSTLRALYSQKGVQNFEVIIVDSGSRQEDINIILDYPVQLYKIRPDEFNFGDTRDYGFSLANGKYIVTLSQDVVPADSYWLLNLIVPFQLNKDVVAVQGIEKKPIDTKIFFWEKNDNFYFSSEVKKWKNEYGAIGLSFVNCSIRQSFWELNNIGTTSFSEDKLFQKHIHKAGKKIILSEKAVAWHGHNYSFRGLINRLIGEGVGWKFVEIDYSLNDCFRDIYKNKWLLKKSLEAFISGEISRAHEIFFPILRPICIYYGNNWKN